MTSKVNDALDLDPQEQCQSPSLGAWSSATASNSQLANRFGSVFIHKVPDLFQGVVRPRSQFILLVTVMTSPSLPECLAFSLLLRPPTQREPVLQRSPTAVETGPGPVRDVASTILLEHPDPGKNEWSNSEAAFSSGWFLFMSREMHQERGLVGLQPGGLPVPFHS